MPSISIKTSRRLKFIAKKLQTKCTNCGILFEQNNDDLKTDLCKKCQDPIKAEARKKLNPNYVDPDPTFEKRVYSFGKWNLDNYKEQKGDRKKFNFNLLATAINQQIVFRTDLETELLYNYNESLGVFNLFSKGLISHIVKLVMKTEYKPSHQNKIIEAIKAENYTDLEVSDKLIAFRNKYYDPLENKITDFYEKVEAEKNPMVIYGLPVIYDPKEPVPKEFIDFIDSTLDPQEKLLIQEIMGFCLLPNYRFQHIFWIFGVSRAGKGVWTRTMKALFGKTFSSVPINHLNGFHRFAEARLHGKLCNICNEPTLKKDSKGQSKYMSVQTLNSLTGQDYITAELKIIQEPIKFFNTAKMIIVSNELPRVRETSDAFYQRLKIIHFKKQFLGKDQIQDYEKQWINSPKKMSGLLNFAITGAIRLLKNKQFTIPESEKALKKQFVRNNDTYKAFIEEKTIINFSSWISRKDLYDFYAKFCNENELFCLPDKSFNSKMRYDPRFREVRKRFRSKRERGWIGLEIKKEGLKDFEIQKLLDINENGPEGPQGPPIYTHSKKSKIINGVYTGGPEGPNGPKEPPYLINCYFCGKTLPEKGWVSGPLSEDKSAHTSCYSQKESELMERELK